METQAVGFDGCDGALWYVKSNGQDGNLEIDSTVYRYQDKNIEPEELGYKYHILTFREQDESSIEVMSAYIGDVRHFIDNNGKAGYNGVMVKHKSIPKKTIKQMFLTVLSNWDFSPKTIRTVIKEV